VVTELDFVFKMSGIALGDLPLELGSCWDLSLGLHLVIDLVQVHVQCGDVCLELLHLPLEIEHQFFIVFL